MASFVTKLEDNSLIATMIFGRFQPPHKSHGQLIDLVIEKANRVGGTPFVFTSKKSNDFNDPSKLTTYMKTRSGTKKKKALSENPIGITDKLSLLRDMHGHKEVIIVDVEKKNISSPYDAINWLISQGFTKIYFFAGSDRINGYRSMTARLSYIADIEMVELPRNEHAVSGTRVRNTALDTSLRDIINTARLYSDIHGNDKCLDKINEIIRIVDLIQKGTMIPEQHRESSGSSGSYGSGSSGSSSKTKQGGRKRRRRTRKRRTLKRRRRKSRKHIK